MTDRVMAVVCALCVYAMAGLLVVAVTGRDGWRVRAEHAEAQVSNVVRLCDVDQLTGAATCKAGTFEHTPLWSAP